MITKGRVHLHDPAVERCWFKFLWRFGITQHERVNKIHVDGYFLALQETIKNKIKRLVAYY